LNAALLQQFSFTSTTLLCRSLDRIERISVAVSTWPQLWFLQLVQSNLNPRAIATPTSSSRDPAAPEAVFRLLKLVDEMRMLGLDEAEWRLVETLIISGRGKLTMVDFSVC
jgi:hypothetical protein